MPSTHYDIFVHGNFIIGLPSETPATVERRLRGIEKVGFDSIGGGPFFLTPGSTRSAAASPSTKASDNPATRR
jgi:tRNA A37 methylthiotransferase MiaB